MATFLPNDMFPNNESIMSLTGAFYGSSAELLFVFLYSVTERFHCNIYFSPSSEIGRSKLIY